MQNPRPQLRHHFMDQYWRILKLRFNDQETEIFRFWISNREHKQHELKRIYFDYEVNISKQFTTITCMPAKELKTKIKNHTYF